MGWNYFWRSIHISCAFICSWETYSLKSRPFGFLSAFLVHCCLMVKYYSRTVTHGKTFILDFWYLWITARVDMVGTNHVKVLTQWRHMPMGQFCANIFVIRITFTYFWASEVFKNLSFYSWLFHSSIISGAKIEIGGTKWVGKTPIYNFSTFGSKINEFEWKKSEKNEKIPKT